MHEFLLKATDKGLLIPHDVLIENGYLNDSLFVLAMDDSFTVSTLTYVHEDRTHGED